MKTIRWIARRLREENMRYLFQISLSVLLLATIAGAQTLEQSQGQKPEQSWENLRTLRIFQNIRVLDQEWRSYEGRFLSVSEEAISFDAGQGERTIRRADVLGVRAARPQTWGQSGPGVWADMVTVYRAETPGNLPSERVGSISNEPACCGCSSETTIWDDAWERQCGRRTTHTRRDREARKQRDSRRSRKAETVRAAAPVSVPPAAEGAIGPTELGTPAEPPQPETPVSESATPDSAAPPAAEAPTDPPAAEGPTGPVEAETPTEPPQPETPVSESATPDSAAPPAAEAPTDPAPTETGTSQSEGSDQPTAEGR